MPNTPVAILQVEDNPAHARLLQVMLADEPFACRLETVGTLAAALTQMVERRPDIALVDLSLPDSTGIETVVTLCSHSPEVPFVVLTSSDDDLIGVEAVHAGAQDYLVKGKVSGSLLVRTVRHAIERHHMARELELTQRQQLDMKDQFLSQVSHELRSPLTAIYQFTTIVTDGLAGDLTPEQQEYLSIVLRNVKQLRAMISDLLDLSRAQSGKLSVAQEPVLLSTVIFDSAGGMFSTASAKKICLHLGDCPADLIVDGDPIRIRQVLTNLIENSIKFTQSGGRIDVHVYRDEVEHGFVRVAVQDTGCGIGLEGLQRMFDHLWQDPGTLKQSRKGLGIGLSICKELVTLHGGRIWAESVQGEGTTVQFTLPLAKQELGEEICHSKS